MRHISIRFLLVFVCMGICFCVTPMPSSAMMCVSRSGSKKSIGNHKDVDRKVKSEIFKEWDGNTLITETGKYNLSPSVKVYDYAKTRSGEEYEHQPIVDFIYLNHELREVVIRPCK